MRSYNYIFAYTNLNLGDDLFISILCNRYPNENFLIETLNKENLEKLNLKNLIIIDKNHFLFKLEAKLFSTSFLKKIYLRKFGRIKCYVQIGGSLFMEEHDWELKLKRHLNFLDKALPYFLIGCNFGPFSNNQYYLKYKEVFKNYTDVCFRDKASYKLFRENSNSRFADDIAFVLEKDICCKQQQQISISLIELKGRKNLEKYRESYINKIIEIIKYFKKKEFEVFLISFCPPEGDSNIMDTIKNSVVEDINLIEYDSNITEIINIIATSKFVIASRFHSMILSVIYGVPLLSIIYSSKISNILKDWNEETHGVKIKDFKNLDVESLYSINKISKKYNNSQEQFQMLDRFLK